MTVYVDDMKAKFGRMVMCHMIGTDETELHAMAQTIGVSRRWYQGDHYDIAKSKRALAVEAGAVEITWLQAGTMMMAVRKGAPMLTPEEADALIAAKRVNARLEVAPPP